MPFMKRRSFIAVSVVGIVHLAATRAAPRGEGIVSAPIRVPLAEGLAEIFGDIKAAVLIGEVYLQRYPDEGHLARLLSGVGIDPRTPAAFNAARFHRRRQQDLRDGNTLLLDGWLMARSELCACALLAYPGARGEAS